MGADQSDSDCTQAQEGASSEAVLGTMLTGLDGLGQAARAATEPKQSFGAACGQGATLGRLLGHCGVGTGLCLWVRNIRLEASLKKSQFKTSFVRG